MQTLSKSSFMIRAVDDDPGVLDALRFALEASGWKIKTYTEPQKFLDELDLSQPGCLILDIRMPEMTGIELQELLNARQFDLPIVFLTGHGDMNTAIHAFRAGAFDFLQKPVDLGELIVVLERVLKTCEQDYAVCEASTPTAKFRQLTQRQKQVLQDLADGLDSKAIAEHLNISCRTLQRHRQNVLKILGLSSPQDAKEFLQKVEFPEKV